MNIVGFTPRLYQETIFSSCSQKNSLVVLPTGMGKTNVFLMLAAHRLTIHPKKKILLLGPTRPLIDQYKKVFLTHLAINEDEVAVFTGHVAPAKREMLWKTSKIIFSTPQGLENDIINKRIDLKEVSLLGIDEAHRAVGDYAYVFVARQYHKTADFSLIVGMTASPGSDMEKIEEVCGNLFVENIEVRTDDDADVLPYIKEVNVIWKKVTLPPDLRTIQASIKDMLNNRITRLKSWGAVKRKDVSFINRTDILKIQAELRGRVAAGEQDPSVWNALSILAELMKMYHGLELLESQGIKPLHSYFEGIYKDSFLTTTKATQNIAKDPIFRGMLLKLESLVEKEMTHPKMEELIKIVSQELDHPDRKILIFNQFRDNVSDIHDHISRIPGARPEIFVGQAKKNGTGLSQKDQKQIIKSFSEGAYNIVISTSIGEEGLDIPKVDTVIFYEPVPSAIRSIQRRGRTGRLDKGKVIILMTEGTKDESYKWSAKHKEARMFRNLEHLRTKIVLKNPRTLKSFIEPSMNTRIIADHREKANHVIRELIDLGTDITLDTLESSDYILSKDVGVEYKTTEDFVNSIINGRLLSQIKELKRNFPRPLIVVQGQDDIYSIRNIHPNAIVGIISAITISYAIPLLFTKNASETARLFHVIAKREQEEKGSDFEMHFEKKKQNSEEQMEYIISSIPGVGITTAKSLLKQFRTVANVMNADEQQLGKTEHVGKKTAQRIRELLDTEYSR